MANTTNLDLVKPAGTDHALISVLNSNSDKIDAFAGQTNDSLSAEQNGLAYIVGNTNTTGGTLAVGQFVYVKGHSTIAEGLRKVTSSISANGSITTSNTDACSEGGLNALNGHIANLDSKLSRINFALKAGDDITYTFSGSAYSSFAYIMGENFIVAVSKAGNNLYTNVLSGSVTATVSNMNVRVTGMGYKGSMCISIDMNVS